MTSIWVARAFHTSMFICFFYGCIFHLNIQGDPKLGNYKFGSWKFLTYWNLVAQCIFYGLMTLVDFLPSNSSFRNQLRKITNPFCSGICVPFAMFVFSSFWGLYMYDRELIFPKALEKIYPVWLNHLSHTLICPAILYECYLNCHTCDRQNALPFFLVMGLGYVSWMIFLGLTFNIWVYPVLYKLNLFGRFVFILVSSVVLICYFLLAEKVVKVLSRPSGSMSRIKKR